MADDDQILNAEEIISEKTLREGLRMFRIAQSAVQEAQEENRRLGIPNWYCINGHIVSDIEIAELAAKREASSKTLQAVAS